MYCSDGGKSGFTRQTDSDLWVCADCLLPTRMVFAKMTNGRVPRNAKWIASVFGRITGVNEVTFVLEDNSQVTCLYYHPYPKKVDMNSPRDLLGEMWHDLDNTVDRIRSGNEITTEYLKAYANGIAVCLQKIMYKFYPDVASVSKEALERALARERGETRESPGLAESIWDPNTRWDGTPYSVENEARARAGKKVAVAPKASGNSIPATAVEGVKNAIASGMFTVKQVATTYSMTEPEVREQLMLD